MRTCRRKSHVTRKILIKSSEGCQVKHFTPQLRNDQLIWKWCSTYSSISNVPYSGDGNRVSPSVLICSWEIHIIADNFIIVKRDFSKRQYEIEHNTNNSIFPGYSVTKKTKKDCYQDKQWLKFTETYAEVMLQDVLHHNLRRCVSIWSKSLELVQKRK